MGLKRRHEIKLKCYWTPITSYSILNYCPHLVGCMPSKHVVGIFKKNQMKDIKLVQVSHAAI
jgi:hypothetical protein